MHGYFCPGPVIFTCVGSKISTTLFWEVNGIVIATYAFRSSDTFDNPIALTVNPPFDQNGIEVEVINATTNRRDINISSELRANNVSLLNSLSVTCADSNLQSNVIHIMVSPQGMKEHFNKLKRQHTITFLIALPPPPFPMTALSSYSSYLMFSRSPTFHLQWSTSFTSQHFVERYHVSVNPDPSSCSMQVNPNEDYNCSGLVLGTYYCFTISAINCGNQEGEKKRLKFVLHGLLSYNTSMYIPQKFLQCVFVKVFYTSIYLPACLLSSAFCLILNLSVTCQKSCTGSEHVILQL